MSAPFSFSGAAQYAGAGGGCVTASTGVSRGGAAVRGGSGSGTSRGGAGPGRTSSSSFTAPRAGAGSLLESSLSLLPAAPVLAVAARGGAAAKAALVSAATAAASRASKRPQFLTLSGGGGGGGGGALPVSLTHALDALAPLRPELALAHAIVMKNANQHRRTLYFRAFRRLCAVSARCVASVDEAAAVARRRGVGVGVPPSTSTSTSTCAELARAARGAEREARKLAQATAATQKGAGFAPLALVLAASAAVFWAGINAAATALEAGADLEVGVGRR